MSALAFIGLAPLVLLGVILLLVLGLAGRGEPDPTGRRTYGVYLFAVTFVSLFIVLFASLLVVQALVQVALPDPSGVVPVPVPSFQPSSSAAGSAYQDITSQVRSYDPNREHWANAVASALVALAAGLVLRFHAERARELVRQPGFEGSTVWRTYQVYIHAVCFVSILIALVAGALAAYGLFRVIAPGVTAQFTPATDERDQGVSELVTGGVLAAASFAIFHFHWRRSVHRSVLPSPAD